MLHKAYATLVRFLANSFNPNISSLLDWNSTISILKNDYQGALGVKLLSNASLLLLVIYVIFQSCLSIHLSVCLSISVCLSVCLSIYLSTHISGPTLDKMCIWLLEANLSHEILRKIYFVVKPFKKGLNKGCWNFKSFFL